MTLNRSITILAALTCASALQASTIYYATLLGTNENPSNSSTASGSIIVTLTGNLLSISETFSGLAGPATGAHIHCCAALGSNTGIALPFTSFPAVTSGSYSQTYDLTLAATYNASFLTATGGTAASAEAALIAGLNSGLAYANIHDATYPGGEIRGQLATPEPATSVLLLSGLIPAIAVIRRKVRKSC